MPSRCLPSFTSCKCKVAALVFGGQLSPYSATAKYENGRTQYVDLNAFGAVQVGKCGSSDVDASHSAWHAGFGQK